MVTEHTMASAELKQLARRLGYSLPQTLPRREREDLARLGRLSGTAFDRAYRQMMVSGHAKAETMTSREVRFGTNVAVRSYATKMLASIDQHHKLAVRQDVVVKYRDETGGRALQRVRP
jgi:putative membrane protein